MTANVERIPNGSDTDMGGLEQSGMVSSITATNHKDRWLLGSLGRQEGLQGSRLELSSSAG